MSTPATPVLDFSRVQREGDAAQPDACKYCTRGLETEYYSVNGDTVCGVCAENVKSRFPADTHKAYVHSLLWGIPAAVLGMAIYAGFEIVTHISIGYLAIGVGYLVAKAMLRGSGGVRGRRYQWTAMLLTYAAVAIAFIPMVIAQQIRDKKPDKTAVVQSTGKSKQETAPAKAADKTEDHGYLYAAAVLLGIGLISPFLELASSFGSGLIGLFILFWGMRAAWQLMAAPKVSIDGPFGVGAA